MTLQEHLAKVKLLACDFDGVFTDNHVYTFLDGSEAIRTSRAEGIGIERLKALGVRVVVITSEPQGIVDVRCKKLGLAVYRPEHWHRNKLDLLKELTTNLETTAYIGNDMNDLECLQAVGVPILVGDAEERVKSALDGKTEHGYLTTERTGGAGAVREVCDLIADAIEAERKTVLTGKVDWTIPAYEVLS